MTLETPKHAQQSQVKLKAKGPKLAKPTPPQTGLGESSGPILREEGGDPGLQEKCRQVMHQPDVITAAPSPVKHLPSKPEAREGELEPSVTLVPVAPMPMSSDYPQLAMEQCVLRLNEQGELVPPNTKSPYSFLPATIGF